jgi:hypothetical protein
MKPFKPGKMKENRNSPFDFVLPLITSNSEGLISKGKGVRPNLLPTKALFLKRHLHRNAFLH